MAHSTLPAFPPSQFPQEQLQSLSEAYHILDSALGDVARLPALAPFRFVKDARQHIAAQVDQLLSPVFEVQPKGTQNG